MNERAIRDWFDTLQACCRAVDFERARPIFAPDAIGFGTFGSVLVGRDHLEAGQWRNIWPNIKDFTFQQDQLRWGADGRYAWGIVTWTSTGFDARGQSFDRPGRATVIFEWREGKLLAIHTHFSLYPRPTT